MPAGSTSSTPRALRARHYSPELGWFLQPDPARAEENPYGYAGNSPVTKADPEGRAFWFAAILLVARVVVAVAPRVIAVAPRLVSGAAALRRGVVLAMRWTTRGPEYVNTKVAEVTSLELV